jgi:hypothetical protein
MPLRVVPQGWSATGAAGSEPAVVAAQGVEELGRARVGVGESGASYAIGDAAAASYRGTGGRR